MEKLFLMPKRQINKKLYAQAYNRDIQRKEQEAKSLPQNTN